MRRPTRTGCASAISTSTPPVPSSSIKGKEYTAHTSKECRVWLLDTSGLGGEDHRTPVYRTPLICNEEVQFAGAGVWGALATWAESNGTRWILVPFWGPKHSEFTAPIEHGQVVQGAVAAFKLEETGGSLRLAPAWLSRDMWQADPVVIANGVVFAYGNGEDATQATFDIGLVVQQVGEPHRAFGARDALRARRADRR